tara:strand:+ start:193658 stop:194314 length:657 start_codon:yes stop_codon:yes gene_type:complete
VRPKTARRSSQGVDSRQRILDATFKLACELGYTATSIGKVSTKSGLPASSIYWHFGNKDALFVAVIEDSFEKWWSTSSTRFTPAEADVVPQAISEHIHSLVDNIVSNTDFWRLGLLLTLEKHPDEPAARRRFEEIRAMVQEKLSLFWLKALDPDMNESKRLKSSRVLARFTMICADGLFVSSEAEGAEGMQELAEIISSALVREIRCLNDPDRYGLSS